MGSVEMRVSGGVAVLTVDRPPVNAFDGRFATDLTKAIASVESSGCRALVIQGVPGVFSAGADLKELAGLPATEIGAWNRALQNALDVLAKCRLPVVAALDGVALGGGFELALAADFRVCTPRTRLGFPEIKLGLLPGAGGTQRLGRLVGANMAKDLLMTGREVVAVEALSLGLVNRVVESATDVALDLATDLARGPATATQSIKVAVDRGLDSSLSAGLQLEAALLEAVFAHPDRVVGIESFLNGATGDTAFEGAEGA